MILYIHLLAVNIILLMIIFGAIGFILNPQKQQYFISKKSLSYLIFLLLLSIVTGLIIITNNIFWLSFPKLIIKVISTVILLIISISIYKNIAMHNNKTSTLIIVFFMIIYSISLLIGSYYS